MKFNFTGKAVKFSLKMLLFLLRLLGFFPLWYSCKTKYFETSRFLRCYSCVMLLFYCLGMPYVFWGMVMVRRHPQSYIDHILIIIQYTTNYAFLVIACVIGIARIDDIKNVLNKILLIWRFLHMKYYSNRPSSSLMKQFVFKQAFADVVLQLTVFYNYFWYGQNVKFNWIPATGFSALYSISVFSNAYIAFTFVISHLYLMINTATNEVILKLETFDRDISYWKQNPKKKKRICCEVSEQLKEIIHLHQLTTKTLKQFVSIVGSLLTITFAWTCLLTIYSVKWQIN